ncbi:MAG: ABC transporter substrate-binding protein [Caulobacteraceae bacterium]
MTIDLSTPSSAAIEARADDRVLTYSICPVFVASHVAVELGWMDEELRAAGARARFLRGLPREVWPIHFNHQDPSFLRDGGNVPAIWAHADRAPTVLIGLTAAHNAGQIVVRADADIVAAHELRGKRIGLPRDGRSQIDWWRSVAERAFQLTLRLAGVDPREASVVDIDYAEPSAFGKAPPVPPSRPRDIWQSLSRIDMAFLPEVQALERGEVDAIYVGQGKHLFLERSGRFKVIEDLSARPDWTLEVANSPFTITASQDIARRHPEILVAWLRAAVRAGRWINANRREAAAIIHDLTYHPTPEDTLAAIAANDFVPNLSPQNLAGIEIAKRSLLELGYISRDFDVAEWADRRFLDEALGSAPA